MNQDLSAIMSEGRTKTMAHYKLLQKQVAGTITPDELTRLNMLTGQLMTLQAQAMQIMGMDENGNIAPVLIAEDENFELELDEDDF